MIHIILIYLSIILVIISIGICVKGYLYFNKGRQIRIEKNSEIEKQNQEKEKIKYDIEELSNRRTELLLAIEKEKQKYDDNIEKEKNKLSEQLKIYKQNAQYASDEYSSTLEQQYQKVEQSYDTKVKKLEQELQDAESRLEELRNSLSAGVKAQLREREKEENIQFYKLSISPIDLEDIVKLNTLKIALHQPVILSKLIWTQYFQKQTTEMCNRILGTKKICGIYKITNLKTQQCYIGQSVDVAQRWKDHVKCGLGIDASTTNKLYNAMQNDGAWSFTFELIEECKREDLNKKEAYWIQMYQSDKFGYNSTKGNH